MSDGVFSFLHVCSIELCVVVDFLICISLMYPEVGCLLHISLISPIYYLLIEESSLFDTNTTCDKG